MYFAASHLIAVRQATRDNVVRKQARTAEELEQVCALFIHSFIRFDYYVSMCLVLFCCF